MAEIEIENENGGETIADESIDETNVEKIERPNVKSVKKVIGRKAVKSLSQEEHDQIVNDARAGIPIENFNVRLYQNGNARITLKKQSKAAELIYGARDEATMSQSQTKKYLTNDQLLMEHIIDLESKFMKMSLKHKKLKKRYNDLESNIYTPENIDDDADETQPHNDVETAAKNVTETTIENHVDESHAQYEQPAQTRRRGWRQRLM